MPAPVKPVSPGALAGWVPDQLNGTYKNPIILADYSDPDAIRVGDDFYLTASSFSCFPGLPILHSRDLVNWTIIGHALPKFPEPTYHYFDTPRHGDGVWAPAFGYHDGTFYIFFGDPDHGIFMVKTKNPAGAWDPAVLVKDTKGWIDTCPLWDDDGNAYLVHGFAFSRAKLNNSLDICRMSRDGTRLLDEGTRVFAGKQTPIAIPGAPRPRPAPLTRPTSPADYTTVEGPKLYKKNRWYYIFAPGGGVTGGYQIVFRSANILGPYDSRIVLEQGSSSVNGPHQGAWVSTQTGQDWFIHFQDHGAYGRITHLEPMTWADGWPVIGVAGKDGVGNPVSTYRKPEAGAGKAFSPAIPQTGDEFNSGSLGLQWQWYANFDETWADTRTRPGFLRMMPVSLKTAEPLYGRPNLLLQKFPAEQFTATVKLDASGLAPGESAGLVVVGPSTASLTVQRDGANIQITRTLFQAPARPAQPATEPARVILPPDRMQETRTEQGDTVYLRVSVASGAQCTFSVSVDGTHFVPLGRAFTAVKDQWIGAKVGLFCNAPVNAAPVGHADFDWFRVE